VKKLKKKEFLALKQGNMTVSEYLDEFTHLSRYAQMKSTQMQRDKNAFSMV
jgi:hypothetical protein